MTNFNTIGVDLAKNIIQISIVTPSHKELSNKALTRHKFAALLAQQFPSLVAFEACASAHYWARLAQRCGHQVKIMPALSVYPFRQGHKTDKNDALAVAEAAMRPHIKVAPLKSIEQQGLQAIQRTRELLVQERTALSNHVRGLLLEFGVVIAQGYAALHAQLPQVLEDGENEVPDLYRPTLQLLWRRLGRIREEVAFLTQQIESLVKQQPACHGLTALEGVGPIGAVLLYATLGTGEAFKNGREFAAYIGLTPKQYSSGGKTHLVGISRQVANKRLRSVLIQGARAYVHKLKTAKSDKDKWILALIERAGYGRAAVALANKNVRTAWALLTQGVPYQKQHGAWLQAA